MAQRNREVLALDKDEVVYPFVQEFAAWHNLEYGTNLKLSDFNTYEFDSVIGVDVPETVHRVHSFLHNHRHDMVSPIEQASEAIDRLSNRFEIHLVTARHPDFRQTTEEYLREYFGDTFQSVTLVGHAATMDVLRTKAEVCYELGAVALVDDSPRHVSGCAELGIGGVLFGQYPWNQLSCHDEVHPDVVHCRNWNEVLAYFDV
jgi:5'(3')-deoxyribonucleotidase